MHGTMNLKFNSAPYVGKRRKVTSNSFSQLQSALTIMYMHIKVSTLLHLPPFYNYLPANCTVKRFRTVSKRDTNTCFGLYMFIQRVTSFLASINNQIILRLLSLFTRTVCTLNCTNSYNICVLLWSPILFIGTDKYVYRINTHELRSSTVIFNKNYNSMQK